MAKFLDENGVLYFWGKIKSLVQANKTTVDASLSSTSENPVQNKAIHSALADKVDVVSGKGLSTNDYTTSEKNKLNGIASGAEVNQNAFSNVKVGNTTIAADTKTDTFEFIAGNGVTLTPDDTNDKLTIAVDNTGMSVQSADTLTTPRAIDGVLFDGSANISHYAICNSGVSSASQVATITPTCDFSLVTGARVLVYMPNGIDDPVADPTLNVNNTGAKPIIFDGEPVTYLPQGLVSEFVYNGTSWLYVGPYNVGEANVSEFGVIKVGSTSIVADQVQDILTFVAGSNVTITPDATNDTVTIAATDTTYSAATSSSDGLMSSSDKSKLDALPTNSTLQSTYATKSEIVNMYKYKGSVADAASLPSSGQTTGDVYNIEAASIYGGAGSNVAWNGSAWDPLG